MNSKSIDKEVEKFLGKSLISREGILRLYTMPKNFPYPKGSFLKVTTQIFLEPCTFLRFVVHDLDFGLLDKFLRLIRKRVLINYLNDISDLGNVLDIGCGRQASLGWDLRTRCNCYFGLDRDVPSVSIDNVILIPAVAEQIDSVLNTRPNFVVLLAVLEHIDDPLLLLHKIKKILTPKGEILISSPHPKARQLLNFLAKLHLINDNEIAEHKEYFDMESLEDLLKEAGFEIKYKKPFLFGLNSFIVGEA